MNRKERGKLDVMNRRRSNNFGSENSLYKLCNCLPYLHSEDWREGGGSRGLEKRNYFDRKWETSRVNFINMLTTSFYTRRFQNRIKTIKVISRKKVDQLVVLLYTSADVRFMLCAQVWWNWHFHQHFTSSFSCKSVLLSFSVLLGLGERKYLQKLLAKCWWNQKHHFTPK